MMKLLSTALFVSLMFSSTKHVPGQWVMNVPIGYEKSGYKIFLYDISIPLTNVLDETSEDSKCIWTESGKLQWKMDLSYFPVQWSSGDTILCFGSWDSAYAADSAGYGDNSAHTGFYWLFSDTLDNKHVQNWKPDDTLRVLPKPIVTKTGLGSGANDTIWIKIPNLKETRRVGQNTYDVLGYLLWADTTGTGTPNALNATSAIEIGFIPVDGVYGDTTVYWQLESDYFLPWNHWNTYFAYKVVVRPDTTSTENPNAPGYSSYYFSQNSDAIDIYQIVIGVGENENPTAQTSVLHSFPNPFSQRTQIIFSISRTTAVKLTIYNASGQLIRTLLDEVKPAGEYTIEFNGCDKNGIALPSGVYFYQLQTPKRHLTERLTKLR